MVNFIVVDFCLGTRMTVIVLVMKKIGKTAKKVLTSGRGDGKLIGRVWAIRTKKS